MLNKIRKTIATAKFNHNQTKRFANVLNQNLFCEKNEEPNILTQSTIAAVIIAAACFWLVVIGLDAQASKLDKKLEQQQFYQIILSTYNQNL